ncbi:MAG: M48 family metallopeptidase, partial [Longimicrobiales bacterium]|nr:M48 family metallopeptidase [Longimicrobiales bacterium]
MPPIRNLLRTLPAVALLVSAACAINPATGERELSFIGEGREIEMGRESDPQVVAQFGIYPDSSVQEYVRDLGMRLAATSERPDLPWTFRVLDDPAINAFALPGGFIYVTRGILGHLENEAQLAGVLGHEIGHVTARHSVSQMSRAQLTGGLFTAAMVLSPEARQFGDLASTGINLAFLKFGRDDEDESDRLGVRYMTRLGYDPRELAGVMGMLARASQLASQGGRLPEWQSTHPDPENRVESILSRVEAEGLATGEMTVREAELKSELDGLTYGPNPREGFTDEGVFHHADLAFRFAPPPGWQVINQKQAVIAVSAQEDAIFELTIVDSDPTIAAREFASQSEVNPSRIVTRDINGLPATSFEFRATAQQERLEGRVAFIRYGGATYRLLGYGVASRWSNHDAA